ncbi:MAG: hypothetical protein ACXWL2_02275 [Candidatus Chromulinivorax sp.]
MKNFLKIQIVFFAFYGVALQASYDPTVFDLSNYNPDNDKEFEKHIETVCLLKKIKNHIQNKEFDLVNQKENIVLPLSYKLNNYNQSIASSIQNYAQNIDHIKANPPDPVQMLAAYRRKNSNK